MPQIGPLEIFIVAAIALIVFGPQKLPELARSIGRFLSDMRRVADEMRSEFASGLDDDEPTEPDDPEPEATGVVADEDSEAIESAAPKPTSED